MKGLPHGTLARQIVNFIRLLCCQQSSHFDIGAQITRNEMNLRSYTQVFQPRHRQIFLAVADNADNSVSLAEQKAGKICAVLARYSGNEAGFSHVAVQLSQYPFYRLKTSNIRDSAGVDSSCEQ